MFIVHFQMAYKYDIVNTNSFTLSKQKWSALFTALIKKKTVCEFTQTRRRINCSLSAVRIAGVDYFSSDGIFGVIFIGTESDYYAQAEWEIGPSRFVRMSRPYYNGAWIFSKARTFVGRAKRRKKKNEKRGEKFPIPAKTVGQVLRKHSSRSYELCRAISEIGFLLRISSYQSSFSDNDESF